MMDFDDFLLRKKENKLATRPIKRPAGRLLKMLCPNELHKCLEAAVLQKARRS